MSNKVIKLIFVADDDTSGMIIDLTMLTLKERERDMEKVGFTFTDKNNLGHQLYLVHAEEV